MSFIFYVLIHRLSELSDSENEERSDRRAKSPTSEMNVILKKKSKSKSENKMDSEEKELEINEVRSVASLPMIVRLTSLSLG